MPTRLSKKGFTLVELLVAMVIILFLGIGLAKGIVELIKLDMRIKARQTAQQVVESWASYIQALPFDSWVISPGEQDCDDPPGTGCHRYYCNNCPFKRGICDKDRRLWSDGWQPGSTQLPSICNDPNDPNCTYCSFMAPDVEVPTTYYPYDSDRDGILDIYDPYEGNNDCKTGQPAQGQQKCREEDGNMKYMYPTWFLADYLRLAPDQGSDDCACRLGNCQGDIPLKCTYQVGKSGGVSWQSAPGNKVYVGITVINYFHPNNITKCPDGKAVGIVAWYFDPIDKKYRAYTKVVFKEREKPCES